MKPAGNIEKLIKKFCVKEKSYVKTSAEMDKRILDDALTAYEKSREKPQVLREPDIWRMVMKSRTTKIAAAAVIIIAIVVGIHHFGGSIDGTSVAFADVLEQIHRARTVAYNQTFYPGESREFTTKKMIIESGIMRSELSHGDIMIFDFSSGKDLHLMPNSKKAILTYRVGRHRGEKLFNYLDWISRIHEEDGEYIGQQELDGKTTDVFVVEVPFEKTTVWVDPETNLPERVRMESWPNPNKDIIMPKMSLNLSDFGGNANESIMISISSGGRDSDKGIQEEMTIVMSDFVWDADLDESLFSLEPPEEYTVEERQFDVSEIGENSLIAALAFWTEMSGGLFPSVINDLADPNQVRPMLIQKFDKDGDPKEEFNKAVREMNLILKGLYFAQEQRVGNCWYYYGDGVRLGDANVPICWWKPKDSDNYRVIYGDLSIGDSHEMPEIDE